MGEHGSSSAGGSKSAIGGGSDGDSSSSDEDEPEEKNCDAADYCPSDAWTIKNILEGANIYRPNAGLVIFWYFTMFKIVEAYPAPQRR